MAFGTYWLKARVTKARSSCVAARSRTTRRTRYTDSASSAASAITIALS